VEHLSRTLCHEYSTRLTHKHKTRLERLARDKHSSLLRRFINYDRKQFYNIGRMHLLKKFCYINTTRATWVGSFSKFSKKKNVAGQVFCGPNLDQVQQHFSLNLLSKSCKVVSMEQHVFFILIDYRGRHRKGVVIDNATWDNLQQNPWFCWTKNVFLNTAERFQQAKVY
jgi:hypothetical protein